MRVGANVLYHHRGIPPSVIPTFSEKSKNSDVGSVPVRHFDLCLVPSLLQIAAISDFTHNFLDALAMELKSYMTRNSRTTFGKIPTSPIWANFLSKHRTRQA